MKWYEFGNGPLRALKVLLESPLDFDPVDFIDRTFSLNADGIAPEALRLAHFYNHVRKGLFPKVGAVPFFLSNSSKIVFGDHRVDTLPLSHELSEGANLFGKAPESLIIRTCDSVNMQVDRLLESFGVNICSGKDLGGELNEFISFYFLSEALFFVLVGVAVVEFDENLIIVKPAGQERVKELHRKWFANHWELLSSIASIAQFDWLPKGADKDEAFGLMISCFGKNLRDKVFSIPAEDLPAKLNRLESVQWISKVCNLAALCMWCQIKNNMDYAPYGLIEKIGVSGSDIDRLMGLIEKRSQPDRIFSRKSQGIKVENPSITNQLRIAINDMANLVSENKLNELLGGFFEKKYVYEYFLREELSDKYKTHPGILAHEVEGGDLNPDVDFILEDLRRNIFYFIQVKYLRIGGKAYIAGDLEHLVSGKLSKGVRQLVDAGKAMNCGKLSKLLSKRGLHNCNKDNSFFLLVHNVSNFDFCVWPSGVISYEWNSLRNLFKDGEATFGHSKSAPNQWRHSQALPVERPDQLISFLMSNGPAAQWGGASSLFETDNVVARARFGNTDRLCCGIGL
ncbi:hypothetical protein D9M68_410640 [compost metagenome]